MTVPLVPPKPKEFDSATSIFIWRASFGTLTGSFTAHPHLDPLTGEQHAIAYEATNPEVVRHVVISPEGQGDPRGAGRGEARAVDP